jgi:hypothetical protein
MEEDVDLANPFGSLLSHFTLSQMAASFIFGVIGIYVFRHGKKTANVKLVFVAVVMMAYPMFTSGWMWDWGIGIALCWLAHYLDQNENITG